MDGRAVLCFLAAVLFAVRDLHPLPPAAWDAFVLCRGPHRQRADVRPPRRTLRLRATAEYRGDPFERVGLGRDASRSDIKKAFRDQIKKAHPDAGGNAQDFQELHMAYKAALKLQGQGHRGSRDASTGPTGSEGWSIRDFYKWRREQVQDEKAQWDADAGFQNTRYRRHWPGSEQRRREQEDQREEKAQQQQDLDNEFRDALRGREQKVRSSKSASGGRPRTQQDADLSRGDWDAVLRAAPPKRRPQGVRQAEKAPRSAKAAREAAGSDGAAVMGHRVVSTPKGPVRVPIYETAGGMRYYHSPLTKAKVNLPN